MTSDTGRPVDTRSAVRRIASGLLLAASLTFVAWQVAKGLPQLKAERWDLSVPALLFSFALLVFNFYLISCVWTILFRGLGEAATPRRMFAILFTAALSRYLPGKVWIFVGQVNAASRMGYKPSTTLAASAVQNIVGNLSNVIMLGVFAALSKRFQVIAWPAFALATVGTVVLFASPAWVEARFNAWRAKRGGEPVRIAVGRASIAKAYVLMLFAWVEHALAFVALVASATPLAWAAAFDLGLAYMLAYQAGFVAFVVPGGLGVREAALTAMLGGVLGAGAAGLVAIAQRLWFLVAELMALPFALWMLRRESSGAG